VKGGIGLVRPGRRVVLARSSLCLIHCATRSRTVIDIYRGCLAALVPTRRRKSRRAPQIEGHGKLRVQFPRGSRHRTRRMAERKEARGAACLGRVGIDRKSFVAEAPRMRDV